MRTKRTDSLAPPSTGARKALGALARKPLQLWHTLLLVFVFGGVQSTQAQTAALFIGFRPVVAATTFTQGVNLIWTLIIIIAFFTSAVITVNGLIELQSGQDGERQRSKKINKGNNMKEKK